MTRRLHSGTCAASELLGIAAVTSSVRHLCAADLNATFRCSPGLVTPSRAVLCRTGASQDCHCTVICADQVCRMLYNRL